MPNQIVIAKRVTKIASIITIIAKLSGDFRAFHRSRLWHCRLLQALDCFLPL